jgi:hypothetical protein
MDPITLIVTALAVGAASAVQDETPGATISLISLPLNRLCAILRRDWKRIAPSDPEAGTT